MKDIVKRLKCVNEESLIMAVVRDCMDAAEEIETLRAENASMSTALQRIKDTVRREELSRKAAPKQGA
ncbi:MAG: hypothetical protein NUV50_00935 [Rhodospirillales bacterium]|nr:hypothetical protein [Rhodospirillales bacterium]